MTDDHDLSVDDAVLSADDDFLSRIASDAYTWDTAPDDITMAFAALRADVGVGLLPEATHDGTVEATVVPIDAGSRRHLLRGRRASVAAGIAVAVLSASGVAAAGSFSNHSTDIGHAFYTFFHGKTASEKAAERVTRLLDGAAADLATTPLTRDDVEAADAKVSAAAEALRQVDTADVGNLAGRLADLEARVAAAFAGLAPAHEPGSGPQPGPGDHDGSGSGDSGDDHSGSSGSGGGDDTGSGSTGSDRTGGSSDGSSGGSDDGSATTGSGAGDGDTGGSTSGGSDSSGSTSGGGDGGATDGSTSGEGDSGSTAGSTGSDGSSNTSTNDSAAAPTGSGSNDGGTTGIDG